LKTAKLWGNIDGSRPKDEARIRRARAISRRRDDFRRPERAGEDSMTAPPAPQERAPDPTPPGDDESPADYDYELPEGLIAQRPTRNRGESRMLCVDRTAGTIQDGLVEDLKRRLRPGDLLVLNDAKVLPARLFGVREDTGGKAEMLFVRIEDGRAFALTKTRAFAPEGTVVVGSNAAAADAAPFRMVFGAKDAEGVREIKTDLPAADLIALLEREGRVPLPPYIRRDREKDPRDAEDAERYQTVYARAPGAAAAPTAGLHFTRPLFDALSEAGVRSTTVTLRVGLGTFKPVAADRLRDHVMHEEAFELTEATVEAVRETRAVGGRVVAVGTTAVRTLEACAADDRLVSAATGSTRLFIRPPYAFRVVDAMVTNFHVPRSTLLMLVSAFAGRDLVRRAYRTAIALKYRFLSYDDAMFLE
jgi:S-adenosylmethionine:tRNA ribosyltransferase-isomerase